MTPLFCIALVVYMEARGEGFEGMSLVADVIATRAERQDLDHCAVVKAADQFAFDAHLIVTEPDKWSEAIIVASETLRGDRPYIGADHFFSGPRPYWATDGNIIGRMGGHTFVDSERTEK